MTTLSYLSPRMLASGLGLHQGISPANSQEFMMWPCALNSEKSQAHASSNASLQQHRATRTSLRTEGYNKTLPLTVCPCQCTRHSSMDSARFLTTTPDAATARLEQDNATSQPRRSNGGRRRDGSSLQHNVCGSLWDLWDVFLPLWHCWFRQRSNQ